MLTRRTFIQSVAAGAAAWPLTSWRPAHASQSTEVLYNGITLGSPWPPRLRYPDEHPVRPAYLAEPPALIPIDVGRQLFVDDFLIEETNLQRTFHKTTYHPANPVLRPEKPWEVTDDYAQRTKSEANPAAMVFSDGVFFDPKDRLFKMWYMGGYSSTTCLATSVDGINWVRPQFDVVPGTNIVSRTNRDSSTVWLDQFERDPQRRFKMSLFYNNALVLYVSPDGVHWTDIGGTGFTGDRSTFFHNPFRNVWAFSLRDNQYYGSISGRYRRYWESSTFGPSPNWRDQPPVAWVKADSRDFARSGFAAKPELYNLDCVAYESLVLGLFSVWRGESPTREKINEVTIGYSRDGFHWHRPDRGAFLPVAEQPGSWNWANVQSAGGGCLIVGDQIYFYVSGRQGRPGSDAPGVCSTGLATLRRDGFASMDWMPGAAVQRQRDGADGSLTTRPLLSSGSTLFVNADATCGELRVEVLDQAGRVIAPFTRQACVPIVGDHTRQEVRWSSASLGTLRQRPIRFRFSMSRGRLFAFWVSTSAAGHSGGYPAAGGPEFSGPIDTGAR